jgi:hypothetical protein
MSRIFVGAQIVPRPAVESAVTHTRNELDVRAAARVLGLQLHAVDASTEREIDTAFTVRSSLGQGRPPSSMIPASPREIQKLLLGASVRTYTSLSQV